jgi:hypothetical protein
MKKLGLGVLLLASILLTGCGGGSKPIVSNSTNGFSQVGTAEYQSVSGTTPVEGGVIQSNVKNAPSLGVEGGY